MAHDSFAVDPQDLSVLLPRQKECHLQIRTSRSRVTTARFLQLIMQRVSNVHSSVMVLHTCQLVQ